jgi:serine/threonine-protein kinase RsbW
LLADSIVINVIQRLHSQSPARRGTLDHLRAEGETLVNRSHPAPGIGPVAGHVAAGQMVGQIAVGTAAATVTLPTDTFEDDAGFEDGTVFLHRDVFCLPAHGTSVATARRRVGELLCAWGVAEPVHDDAALVVSELFTNALVHTDSSEITCRIQTTMETVYLAITDQGHGEPGPEVREPEEAENGRGLLLVNALAELWGVRNENGLGRTVWAVLPWECDEATSEDA